MLPAVSQHVGLAVAALRAGEVIAVPTDTLYGLAADACSAAAVQRVYAIKGRDLSNALAICVADVADVDRFAATAHLPAGLLDALFPGPVTLVLPRGEQSQLDAALNPGLPNVGVRVPDADFVRAVARGLGGALALTSANASRARSTVCIDEFRGLWPACARVFDAGPLPGGSRAGSTVVDLSRPGGFRVLRPGSALEHTRRVLEEDYGLREGAEGTS